MKVEKAADAKSPEYAFWATDESGFVQYGATEDEAKLNFEKNRDYALDSLSKAFATGGLTESLTKATQQLLDGKVSRMKSGTD